MLSVHCTLRVSIIYKYNRHLCSGMFAACIQNHSHREAGFMDFDMSSVFFGLPLMLVLDIGSIYLMVTVMGWHAVMHRKLSGKIRRQWTMTGVYAFWRERRASLLAVGWGVKGTDGRVSISDEMALIETKNKQEWFVYRFRPLLTSLPMLNVMRAVKYECLCLGKLCMVKTHMHG